MKELKSAFVNYFNFRGTATEKEFLYFSIPWLICFVYPWLRLIIVNVIGSFLDLAVTEEATLVETVEIISNALYVLDWFLLVLWIITAIPFLSLSVRRLHGMGCSGWWALLLFIPWINIILWFLLAGLDMKEVKKTFVNTFNFRGTASKRVYQQFWAFVFLVCFVSILLPFPEEVIDVILILFRLVIIIPFLSLAIRRFRDIGWSFWLFLLLIFPLVNGVFLIVLLFALLFHSGTNKQNPNQAPHPADDISNDYSRRTSANKSPSDDFSSNAENSERRTTANHKSKYYAVNPSQTEDNHE